MCTVLQQHLALTDAAVAADGAKTANYGEPAWGRLRRRTASPSPPRAEFSYLGCDPDRLKRPIEPYDRMVGSAPTATHFHVPPGSGGGGGSGRQRLQKVNDYVLSLHGRRSRSHSRTGMRVLVDQLDAKSPRPKSPGMNNQEPINLSHYPDGRASEERPIEKDDFPAPPFAHAGGRKQKRTRRRRRRHWSEPGKRMPFCKDTDESSHDEDSPYESSGNDDEEPKEYRDPDLEKKEVELKKIKTAMGKIFLTELALEKQNRMRQRSMMIDPRSAARTPSANREPHFRLRYDCPVNASPSRIANHVRPWDDDVTVDGRPSYYTPFTTPPLNHHHHRQTATKSSTLPPMFSLGRPAEEEEKHGYSTDFTTSSKSDFSDGEVAMMDGRGGLATVYHSTPRDGAEQRNAGSGEDDDEMLNGYLPGSVTGSLGDSGTEMGVHQRRAPNVYPLHLLQVTNYRLPGDVDRANLERHLTDKEFENVFGMQREEFYDFPYWKRCDIKRKINLF